MSFSSQRLLASRPLQGRAPLLLSLLPPRYLPRLSRGPYWLFPTIPQRVLREARLYWLALRDFSLFISSFSASLQARIGTKLGRDQTPDRLLYSSRHLCSCGKIIPTNPILDLCSSAFSVFKIQNSIYHTCIWRTQGYRELQRRWISDSKSEL